MCYDESYCHKVKANTINQYAFTKHTHNLIVLLIRIIMSSQDVNTSHPLLLWYLSCTTAWLTYNINKLHYWKDNTGWLSCRGAAYISFSVLWRPNSLILKMKASSMLSLMLLLFSKQHYIGCNMNIHPFLLRYSLSYKYHWILHQFTCVLGSKLTSKWACSVWPNLTEKSLNVGTRLQCWQYMDLIPTCLQH